MFYFGDWLNSLGLSFVTIPIPIHAYALCILIGIVVATLLTGRRLKNRGADPGVVLDIAIWAVPFGIIGGRIFHVVTHPNDYFFTGANLWAVTYVWEGGLAIFGALIFGALGVFIGCRRHGLRFWSFADALAPGLLLAQAFGRLGNYFNHELFGLPTTGWWGLEIESTNPAVPIGLPADTLFQPTFAYEIIWNLIGVAALLLAERHFRRRRSGEYDVPALVSIGWRLQWGRLLGLYLVWYGSGRIVWESIRIDPSEIYFGVRVNVWAALGAVVLGFIIIIIQRRRHPGDEPSPYLPGREWSRDSGVDSSSTDLGSDGDDDGDSDKPVATKKPATSKVGAQA